MKKLIICKVLFLFSLSSISFKINAMQENVVQKGQTQLIQELSSLLDNHEYEMLRMIIYKNLEHDKSGKLFNWIKARAKSHAMPFFWYMIARDFYYKIITNRCANSSSDITNLFRAMTICLTRIYQDVMCLKSINSKLDYSNTYNTYKNKFIYWKKYLKNSKSTAKIVPNFSEVIGQVETFFYPKTNNGDSKLKVNLSCPDWITVPMLSKITWKISFEPVNEYIKIISTEKHNIEEFKIIRKSSFNHIMKKLQTIAESNKTDLEKWDEFFELQTSDLDS